MSNFNIGSINGTATISLGNGENVNVKKLTIKIDGKIVETEKEVSMKIENNVLIITTK